MNKLPWTETFIAFLNRIAQIAALNSVFLLVMSGFRAFSHLYYGDPRDLQEAGSELWRAYWVGMRFDLSALCYLAVIPLLALLLTSMTRQKKYFLLWSQTAKTYFVFSWSFLLICLATDTGYYSYFQDHINVLIFGLAEDDTAALIRTFWKNYPVVWILSMTAVALYLFYRIIGRIMSAPTGFTPAPRPLPALVIILGFFLPAFLLSLGARGSLGLFPLSVADTVVSSRSFVNHLSYNGFHALIRAVKLKSQQNVQWDANLRYFGYTDVRQPFADYFGLAIDQVPSSPLDLLRHQTPKNPWAEKVKPHVIVIMMESFASSYLKYNSTEFNVMGELKSHFAQDYLWLHFMPSHSSTVGSLSSFMISTPQRPQAGFLTESDTLQVPFRSSSARVFHSAGYDTHFLYGGNPGWRDMNKFGRFQGFDHIEGDVDIQKKVGPLKETHDWGVYDEDVYKYIWQSLQEASQPQFFLTMTTTNHPPYQVPSNYQVQALKIPADLESRLVADRNLVKSRFQVYQYANQKLGEFLTQLKNSPWADKVIVAVTGDHGFWMVNFTDQELLQKWGVPFYLYTPPALRPPATPQIFGSHMDIFPTLYSLALSEVEYLGLGSNLFDPKAAHFAPHASMLALSEIGAIRAGPGDKFDSYLWNSDAVIATSPTAQHLSLAKRYKALMSIADVYFMEEKKRSKHP